MRVTTLPAQEGEARAGQRSQLAGDEETADHEKNTYTPNRPNNTM